MSTGRIPSPHSALVYCCGRRRRRTAVRRFRRSRRSPRLSHQTAYCGGAWQGLESYIAKRYKDQGYDSGMQHTGRRRYPGEDNDCSSKSLGEDTEENDQAASIKIRSHGLHPPRPEEKRERAQYQYKSGKPMTEGNTY